jgi:hypothetical protein
VPKENSAQAAFCQKSDVISKKKKDLQEEK